MNDTSLKSWALRYAEKGFAVYPCYPKTKAVLKGIEFDGKDMPDGRHPTTDLTQIEAWWTANPNYNVGIATGSISRGLVVIDVDMNPFKKKEGDISRNNWELDHGKLPDTCVAVSGSGGVHYYYISPDKYKTDENHGGLLHIDFLAEKGKVLAPPSIHPETGQAYEWVQGMSPFDNAPTMLSGSAKELAELGKKDVSDESQKNSPVFTVPDTIDQGARVSTLVSLIGSLRNKGLSDESICQAIKSENDTRCNPPLTSKELDSMVFPALSRNWKPESPYFTTEEPVADSDLEIPLLSSIQERSVEWLIPGYLPKGQITLMCGTGGVGKTSIWTSLVASFSSGSRTLFDGHETIGSNEPMMCMFFSAEDTVAEVLKPRMRKQHANMNNIMTLGLDDSRFDKVKFGSKYLEELLNKYRPALCVFDPLQAFIDPKIRMADRNAMRQSMRPLIEWGKAYGTTFLVVMHTNKQSGVWGRQRMADSADLWDIARSVLMVGDADETGLKYLSHEKSNYGKTGKTMLFRNDSGLPVFTDWTDCKDRDYVQDAARKRNAAKSSNTVEEVCGAILAELSDHPSDGMPVKELDEIMKQTGYVPWTIRRAKTQLINNKHVRIEKEGFGGSFTIKRT